MMFVHIRTQPPLTKARQPLRLQLPQCDAPQRLRFAAQWLIRQNWLSTKKLLQGRQMTIANEGIAGQPSKSRKCTTFSLFPNSKSSTRLLTNFSTVSDFETRSVPRIGFRYCPKTCSINLNFSSSSKSYKPTLALTRFASSLSP